MGRSESFAAPLSQDLLDTQYLPRKRLTCPDRVEREYGSEKCRRMTESEQFVFDGPIKCSFPAKLHNKERPAPMPIGLGWITMYKETAANLEYGLCFHTEEKALHDVIVDRNLHIKNLLTNPCMVIVNHTWIIELKDAASAKTLASEVQKKQRSSL